MKNIKLKYIIIILMGYLLCNCEKVLDKSDLNSVSEDALWNDDELADAYIAGIYDRNLPTWNRGISDRSDESNGGDAYMYGQLTESSVNTWRYSEIRGINILLANIGKGTVSAPVKNKLKGEAYFFRAWTYFVMVRDYGGVPLILEPQKLSDDLFVSRAKTSEVIAQIISDLDSAIVLLPTVTATSGENKGRVHKGTAMAVKGRVLLYWASPQFDPTQNAAGRWQAAYDANKTALDHLNANGFGLLSEFKNIWITEMNKEVLFVTRYEYPLKPEPTNWINATRPLDMSSGASGGNQPTLEMVNAFPMKDGKAINDPTSAYTYNPGFFWQNRDPRFAKTIAYNGSKYELSGLTGRIQWTFVGSEVNSPTQTGFYCRKAVNESKDVPPLITGTSDLDFVALRYAEVMLNLAEAANKIGKSTESYDQLKAIRARAGIDPGSNTMYGLESGMSQAQMQNAILWERQIELAFENQRYWDLRRNRMYESLLNGTRRHGYWTKLIVPKTQWNSLVSSMSSQALLDHLSTKYTTYFRDSIIKVDTQFDINWKPEYYFYGIPTTHIQQNANLKQTLGWPTGTFDPLL